MANMKVGTRLGLGFGAVCVLLIIVATLGVMNMRSVQGELDDIVNDEFPKTVWANNVIDGVNSIGIHMRDSLLESKIEQIQKELDSIEGKRKYIKENIDKLEEHIASEKGKAALAKVKDMRGKYVGSQDAFLKLQRAGKKEEARVLFLAETMDLQDGYIKSVNELIALQSERMVSIGKEAEQRVKSGLVQILIITLVALLVAVVVGFLIVRNLMKQLGGEPDYAAEEVKAIAAGDLTHSLEVKSGDTTSLMYSLKTMQDALKSLISNVKGAVDSINTGASEISNGNSDLSQRTEEQASSLEETASSMEELTSTVKQNAENSKQANQLARGASDVAVKGGEVVGKVVNTMSSINDSSKKIVDIISVIEGIAFQTNILALNAAVEAARAGEQGRGFAVVASEVRSLAQRSAAAAKEIKALISDSVSKVEDGTVLVDEAGKTMEEIVSAVRRVTDIMSEISAASAEQSSGIEQVNQAIMQMDNVTQQNAALVEEAAAAAESLEEEAQNLSQAVSVFKLDASSGVQVARTRPVAHQEAAPKASAVPAPKVAPKPAPDRRKAAGKAKALPSAKEEDEEWKEF